ncbi:TM0106 family RecB-like putative nuclease [Tamaricihabitans halophyticus]|uniref:TM0106 family RecB-like putative nuclease n=1 Tax=Tamaricihabitans halophyticus TaxID=1262583 RepID=UPI001051DA99|nr:TM0106 family RecB-like putative nuclease [Tamaricihabitans halophyticus]
MNSEVLLDAGAVTRCRRRVHLEHDQTMVDVELAPPDPAGEQRKADAAAHRRSVADELAAGREGWVEIPSARPAERARATLAALAEGVPYIWGGLLPADREDGRKGGAELLLRTEHGYVPLIVVRHKVSDPGEGANTSSLADLHPDKAGVDAQRKVRPQPRDQLRLAHLYRMLEACGYAERGRGVGGAIGQERDAVIWHDLTANTWPGDRCALDEYDARFADRIAIANAAVTQAQALAQPSRVVECRRCPWWPVCSADLRASRDVSLVVRGEDASELRAVGVSTVDALATVDPDAPDAPALSGLALHDAVALARAWLHDLTVVRKVEEVAVPRADVEVDVDMESFGDGGAYLWGCLLSGVDIGVPHGYHAFATWEPVPTPDEGRSFAEFWAWLTGVRSRTAARGLSFRAYCYNEMAENRWMLSSAERFADQAGVPSKAAINQFIRSAEWVDLFRSVNDQFLCAHGKGLKVVAPVAGFAWRDAEAGGENSMRWYRDAVGMDGDSPAAAQRERLLQYNEDDVRATFALREWMDSPEVHNIPYVRDL